MIEIKTLRDLKSAIEKIKKANEKKKSILNDDNLTKNQMKRLIANLEPTEKEIEEILNKYSYVFNVTRGDLRLEELFNKHKIQFSFNPFILQTESVQEGFYKDHTIYDLIFKDEIEISIGNITETIVFADFNTSSYTQYDELKYLIGDYSVNVLDFILEDKYACSSILREACWNAVACKYEQKHARAINKKTQDKNLLVTKLEILQNEELRNNEIASLKKQISDLNAETELIENDELNVQIG